MSQLSLTSSSNIPSSLMVLPALHWLPFSPAFFSSDSWTKHPSALVLQAFPRLHHALSLKLQLQEVPDHSLRSTVYENVRQSATQKEWRQVKPRTSRGAKGQGISQASQSKHSCSERTKDREVIVVLVEEGAERL